MARTLVIAEPGCTHEGEWSALMDLIYTARECGADVWKPQWTSDPVAMCERRHIGPDHEKRAYYEQAYRWLNFPVEWHQYFKAICDKIGLQYAVTCFLSQDVATVAPYVDYLKIASFENSDWGLLAHALNEVAIDRGKTVILSAGMRDKGWTNRTIYNADWRVGQGQLRVLHCVSSYPAPLEAMDLGCITEIHDPDGFDAWRGYDGLSDHSRHLLAGALAVAVGAHIVETHYRLDSCDPHNPDYAVAFTPKEFTQYIQNIRDAEIMLGSGEKKLQPCEEWALPYRVTA